MSKRLLFAPIFLWGLLPACGARMSTQAAPPTDPAIVQANHRNPFLDVDFFLNPDYGASVEAAAQASPAEAEAIRKVKRYPTALFRSRLPIGGQRQGRASGREVVPVLLPGFGPQRHATPLISRI